MSDFERRALEHIEISQHALLHVVGIRGCHPCLVVNFHPGGAMLHSSTHHTATDLICHWMASKRQGIAVWCGGTEIPAASNLSIMPDRTGKGTPSCAERYHSGRI